MTIQEWIKKKKQEEKEFGWEGEWLFQKHLKLLFRYRDYLLRTCPDSQKIIESLRLFFWYG